MEGLLLSPEVLKIETKCKRKKKVKESTQSEEPEVPGVGPDPHRSSL